MRTMSLKAAKASSPMVSASSNSSWNSSTTTTMRGRISPVARRYSVMLESPPPWPLDQFAAFLDLALDALQYGQGELPFAVHRHHACVRQVFVRLELNAVLGVDQVELKLFRGVEHGHRQDHGVKGSRLAGAW